MQKILQLASLCCNRPCVQVTAMGMAPRPTASVVSITLSVHSIRIIQLCRSQARSMAAQCALYLTTGCVGSLCSSSIGDHCRASPRAALNMPSLRLVGEPPGSGWVAVLNVRGKACPVPGDRVPPVCRWRRGFIAAPQFSARGKACPVPDVSASCRCRRGKLSPGAGHPRCHWGGPIRRSLKGAAAAP